MMNFRPCIDLHGGKVVQIVGGSLSDEMRAADGSSSPSADGPLSHHADGSSSTAEVNFTSERGADEFARLYKKDDLKGGHVIALGAGNKEAAISALNAFPGGMQYGGGVTPANAGDFLDAGASHVIVTSYIFSEGCIDFNKLEKLMEAVGRERLVLDLSCRQRDGDYYVVTDRWQTFTREKVSPSMLETLAVYCAEFLVHGVDVEGKRQGIEENLINTLGVYSPLKVTYAGGVSKFSDLELVKALGQGRVDLTIGSALDIFGGNIPYEAVLEWNRQVRE